MLRKSQEPTAPPKRTKRQPESNPVQRTDLGAYGSLITLGYHHTAGRLDDPLFVREDRNKVFELSKAPTSRGLNIKVVVSDTIRKMRSQQGTGRRRSARHQPVNYVVAESENYDVFQFGRDSPNDYLTPGHDPRNGEFRLRPLKILINTVSLVSRMAFRLECDRTTGVVRIYAGGIDCANELFLGFDALIWTTQIQCSIEGQVHEIEGDDGGITAGLHLWKPNKEGFTGNWYEVSVLGKVYHLRTNGARGEIAEGVDNKLEKGSIIVNAECVLLFAPPNRNQEFLTLQVLQTYLDNERISLDRYPLGGFSDSGLYQPSPGVFPKCGHVRELSSGFKEFTHCPKCRVEGEMLPLMLQTAPTFFPFKGKFNIKTTFTHVLPCGHAVSKELGQRMAAVALPTNDMLTQRDRQDWVDCLRGDKRRCWLCGSGFLADQLQKLDYEDYED